MDYEKKYKEALANARQEYNTTENVERKQWLEELFPELKEKFKVGDWIVNNKDNTYGIIRRIHDDNTGFEKDYHLWTIQDAKDGDVLVNGSNIFIFHFINDTRLMGYCHVNTDDGRFYDDIGKNECFCLIDAVVNPATNEQRYTLFNAMKEAGYEWSSQEKKLSKI